MRPSITSRFSFVVALLVTVLVMVSCAVPVAPDQPPSIPPTQPPVTVLVVVTATSAQPADVQPTATATIKSVVVQPSATPTGKSVAVEPTATSTGKPSTAQPTATSTSKPPTAVVPPAASATPTGETNKAPDQKGTGRGTTPATRIATPTATSTGEAKERTGRGGATPATPTTTLTPEPLTREFWTWGIEESGTFLGGKGDTMFFTGERMPPGCEVFKVLGQEYDWLGSKIRGTAESFSDGMHGWSVTKQNNDPRDYGVKIHWWYNAPAGVRVGLVYIVRQPWNVDCLVPGKIWPNS